MRKWWVKVLLVFGVVLLGLWGMLLTSSLRSRNAVDQYKDQLRAAGEKLNANELLPPPVAPEKNGASLFEDASRYMNSGAGALESNMPPAMRMVAPGKAMIGWQQSEIIGFYGSGVITNSWDDFDRALQSQAPAFDLLRQAAERPQLDFGLDYRAYPNIPITHLTKPREAAMILWPAVISDLHRGDTASSVTNLHTLLALIDAWKGEPMLISELVRIAITGIASTAQWEVLQATNLTDQELATLQRDWETMEFVQPMEKSLTAERDWQCVMIERLRGSNSPSMASQIYPGSGSTGGGSGGLLDDFKMLSQAARRKTSDTLWRISWSYSDELRVLRGQQAMINALRRANTNGYFKDALAQLDRELSAIGFSRVSDNWFRNKLNDEIWGSLVEPAGNLKSIIQRTLVMEVTRKVIITAIALKRYQLRHRAWPADLNALVPEFLPEVPRDPVDGKPLRYRPNPDGTFLLYSIGADGKDGGGDVSPLGPSRDWLRAPDWVWPQPATAAEIQKYYDNLPK